MIRMLSDKEVQQHKQEIDQWWQSLDDDLKYRIYNMFEHVDRQRRCAHPQPLSIISNPTNRMLMCGKCGLVLGIE